ncbi:MAG: T9SS type A sorting domain-containing protein [Hymenobacter sp.]|nr:MAG: T9SS type A sorting domain-containing protein [Hymenobacter sp.]
MNKSSNDATSKTLTRNGITGSLNALFTLGNADNPLPVTITSFTAVAQGTNAVLNWATASETNNQGFEVQVSTDGTTFSKLGFLASNNPNSTTPHSYQYRDVTAGKQGVRYYRLRQLDLDGTASFVGPRAVTFGDAVAQATSLQGYPSPFSSEINLALQTTAAGLATVTVTDGVGRQVRAWQPTLAAGASSLRLADLQNMPAGLYIVQVRYSDGQTQRLKMVKE